MKNTKLLLIIPLLIISILPILPTTIPNAHAATGTVCLTDTSATTCPTSPPTLFAAVGSQLMVQVLIAGSDNLNGFNIQIKTDNTVLSAADASLTGSIIGSGATVVLKCLDGTLISGPACESSDGPGVLHFAATKLGATVAGNGLLFTAIYNVVAKTAGIPVDILSSSISNGTSIPNSETTLGATFSNLTDFGIDSSPASISTPPGVSASSTITLTSFGGYNDVVTLTVTPTAGLTASTVDSALFLPPDGTATTTLTVSAATSGNYAVDVTGTGSNPLFTHTVHVPVAVAAQDFTVAANPTSLALAPGSSGTSTITVGSISGFVGSVTLTGMVSPAGPTASFAPNPVNAGSTSTLTVTVPAGTTAGMYTVTVTGTSGAKSHSTTVSVNVGQPDFSISALPDIISTLRLTPISTSSTTFQIKSINNFAATLTFSTIVTFPYVYTAGSSTLPYTLPGSVMLSAGGTAAAPMTATLVKTTTGTGLYVFTVTATGGGKTHTAIFKLWVIDFSVSPASTSITMINNPGTRAQIPVQINALGAPNNDTGFAINPGTTEGTAAFPPQYGYNSGAGRAMNKTALGLTGASSRCFLKVSDSLGHEILPVIAGGRVQSYAGPMVHVNGDQFGFPANADGCRFDSFWYVDPANGNTLGDPFDTAQITIEVLKTTPVGTYTAEVCFQAGSDINCINETIRIVAQQTAPEFNTFNWNHAPLASSHIVTFTARFDVLAGATQVTQYAKVVITAVRADGSKTIIGSSSVVAVAPGANSPTFTITLSLTGIPAGVTFNFDAQIVWGVDPAFLLYQSNNVNPNFSGAQESPTGMSGAFKTA